MKTKSDTKLLMLSDKRTFKIVKNDQGKCTEIWVNEKLYWQFTYDELGNLKKQEQFYYKRPIKSLEEVLEIGDDLIEKI